MTGLKTRHRENTGTDRTTEYSRPGLDPSRGSTDLGPFPAMWVKEKAPGRE